MGVNIQRCACLCMTQQTSHCADIHALRNQQAGVCMPQTVYIQIQRQVVCFQNQLETIFKRFYRSRFSQDTQGIGLGLPLAKAIVEAHHGTIEVDSELGKGTTFTLNFPIPTKL